MPDKNPKPTKTYLTYQQRQDIKDEITQLERDVSNPLIQNRGQLQNSLKRAKDQLETQGPPHLNPEQRDKVNKKRKMLEQKIRETLLPQQDMRHNPPGAVGELMRQEQLGMKKMHLQWKNCMRALYPDSSDPDLSNIERLRPMGSRFGLDGAQIPHKVMSLPSEQYRENYDGIDWTDQPTEQEARMADLLDEELPEASDPHDVMMGVETKAKLPKSGDKMSLSEEERERRRQHMRELNERKKKKREDQKSADEIAKRHEQIARQEEKNLGI